MSSYTNKEQNRLKAMKNLMEIKFDKEVQLRNLTEITAQLLNAPVSMVTMLDEDVQHIIYSHGIDLTVMPRATSFCTHTIESEEVLLVTDALEDDRFKNLPLVKFSPNVRFYAGIAVKSENMNVGTLCVFNDKPMTINAAQSDQLKKIGEQVSNILTLNLSLELLKQTHQTVLDQYRQLREIAFIQSHEVRAPLCNAMALTDILRDFPEENKLHHIHLLEKSLTEVDNRIHRIVELTSLAVA